MSVKKLADDLKNGTLARIYYIFGEEEYLKRSYLDQLKEKGAEEPAEFNLIEIPGRKFDLTDFMNSVNSYPVLGGHKLVCVTDMDNALLKKDLCTKLTRFLKDSPDFCTVVFYDSELKNGLSNTALSKVMDGAGAVVVNVGHPSVSSLTSWCRRHFKNGGKEIDEKTVGYLFDYCGTDMMSLKNEIDKLCSGSPGDTVTAADINRLSARSIEADRYRIIDSFCAKNYSAVYKIIDGLYDQGNDDIAIANTLYYAFLDLRHARAAIDCGRSRQELIQAFGMRPFIADKMLKNARGLDSRFVAYALEQALELDRKLKSSPLNKRELITVFIAQLAGERG